MLCSGGTKASINTTLDIADKLLKSEKEERDNICISLCDGLISKDESVQKKIATLLAKYGNKEQLSTPLAAQTENILMVVRPLLNDLMDSPPPIPEKKAGAIINNFIHKETTDISDANKISPITSLEDYLFYLNRVFNKGDAYELMLLPKYIMQFHKHFTAENLNLLEPSVKRAHSMADAWEKQFGRITKLYAIFFVEYLTHLNALYPGSSQTISNILEKKLFYMIIGVQK